MTLDQIRSAIREIDDQIFKEVGHGVLYGGADFFTATDIAMEAIRPLRIAMEEIEFLYLYLYGPEKPKEKSE